MKDSGLVRIGGKGGRVELKNPNGIDLGTQVSPASIWPPCHNKCNLEDNSFKFKIRLGFDDGKRFEPGLSLSSESESDDESEVDSFCFLLKNLVGDFLKPISTSTSLSSVSSTLITSLLRLILVSMSESSLSEITSLKLFPNCFQFLKNKCAWLLIHQVEFANKVFRLQLSFRMRIRTQNRKNAARGHM